MKNIKRVSFSEKKISILAKAYNILAEIVFHIKDIHVVAILFFCFFHTMHDSCFACRYCRYSFTNNMDDAQSET